MLSESRAFIVLVNRFEVWLRCWPWFRLLFCSVNTIREPRDIETERCFISRRVCEFSKPIEHSQSQERHGKCLNAHAAVTALEFFESLVAYADPFAEIRNGHPTFFLRAISMSVPSCLSAELI